VAAAVARRRSASWPWVEVELTLKSRVRLGAIVSELAQRSPFLVESRHLVIGELSPPSLHRLSVSVSAFALCSVLMRFALGFCFSLFLFAAVVLICFCVSDLS